jgi:hypothetical protein
VEKKIFGDEFLMTRRWPADGRCLLDLSPSAGARLELRWN